MPQSLSDQPAPGPDCARYASLLPLLDADELSTNEAAAVRSHTDSCPWCQQQRAAYATVDAALHRHLDALMAAAPIQTEEAIMQIPEQDRQSNKSEPVATSPLSASRPPQRSRRGIFSGVAALAAVLLLALLAGLLFASHGSLQPGKGNYGPINNGGQGNQGTAQGTCNPNRIPPGVPGNHITINSISMVSATDGWAVGTITSYQVSNMGQGQAAVIMRLSNGKWTQFGPTYPVSELKSISMDSPGDGWALGLWHWENGVPSELLLHYTGGRWVQVPALSNEQPNFASPMKVVMVSPTEGWMLIQDDDVARNPHDPASRGTIIIRHYLNGTWTPVPIPSLPDTVEFHDMSATANGGVWFVGPDYGNGPNIIAHYSQGHWSITREQPDTPDLMLESISMASATDGWALETQGPPTPALLLHYNGTSWAHLNLPGSLAGDYWDQLYAFADGDVWLTGYQQDARYHRTAVMARYVNGNWQEIPYPFSIPSTANVFVGGLAQAAPGEFWAAGTREYLRGCAPALVTDVSFGSFLHYANGSWSKQDLP